MPNKYAKILAAIEALPPSQRKLSGSAAWQPRNGCGCLFGTVVPKYPRDRWSTVDFRLALMLGPEKRGPGLNAARQWFEEVGLTLEDVGRIQSYNDACLVDDAFPSEEAACRERFRRVRDYVAGLAATEAPP